MLNRLLGRGRRSNRTITDALYDKIVAAARQPELYSAWHVPDTPLGRFEMLALHMFLLQHRLRDEPGAAREVGQVLIDEFFGDVDHSLRELGIGDMGIPRRMKKLARMYYGRTGSYGDALDRGDAAALASALARNVRPEVGEWREAAALAAYVQEACRMLGGQDAGAICAGSIRFPAPRPN